MSRSFFCVAERAHARQVIRAREIDPAFGLDGLHENGAGGGPDRPLHRLEVVPGNKLKTRHQGLEPLMKFFLARGRQGCHGPAVKGFQERDDLVRSGPK